MPPTLGAVAEGLLKALLVLEGLKGLCTFRTHALFLERSLGLPLLLATCFLGVLFASKLAFVAAVAVPSAATHRVALHLGLAAALALQLGLALASDDAMASHVCLLLVALKNAVVGACSRRLVTYEGSVGGERVVDTIADGLRRAATRYKFNSLAIVATAVIVVHGCLQNESLLAGSQLTASIAQAQWARSAGLVALVLSVGSEDVSARRGLKKSL